MDLPVTVTLSRDQLIDALDVLADVAGALERHADSGAPLADPDALIRVLRAIVVELSFAVEASDLLS
ncbi:MAG TPA: hypothetical protein VI854_01875 [Acidimicrobiia bacterium]|nr:hypothetical protein [Acidimicrobiia bacterium]